MSGTAARNASAIVAVVIGTASSGNNVSWSHTVTAGSNLGLLVLAGTHQGTITNVTWNLVSLTKIDSGRSTLNECGDAWILINPTPATGNVVITMSGGSWKGGIAVNLSNLAQTTAVTRAIANGNSGTASVSIAPPSSYCLIVAATGTEGVPTKASALTYVGVGRLQNNSYENLGAAYIQATGTGTQTMSFSLDHSDRWGIVAVALAPVSVTETQFRLPSGTRVASGARITPAI